MTKEETKLIRAGIRNLKEFGYTTVNETNILTDYVYRALFRGMLWDNLGKGQDTAIKALLKKIEGAK